MDFCIVISTLDRREELLRALASVAERSGGARAAWEVLVVDNGSRDGTRDAVEALAARFPLPLRCVVEPARGLSNARNRGLASTESAVVCCLDDDVTLHPSWFGAIEAAYAEPELAGHGGRIVPVFPPNASPDYVRAVLTDRCGSTGLYDEGDAPLWCAPRGPASPPHGGNMGFRAAVGREVGGFRPDLGLGESVIQGEETDFFLRVVARGHAVRYLPDASVDHHLQADKVGWPYLRRWHHGYGRASVRRRPAPSLAMRCVRVAEQAWTWVRYAVAAPFVRGNAMPRTKRWRAEGRLAELLGL